MKEQFQTAANLQQAQLDQMWKIVDDNFVSLEQTLGVCSPGGIITSYLTIVYCQAKLNRLNKLISEL